MAIVLMGLGPWRFGVPGINYRQLNRRYAYRWVPQMRIGTRPAEQFLGPGEEELRIHGIMFPFNPFSGPRAYSDLNDMRDQAQMGVPYGLADAHGIYWGPWCIRMILDEQEFFHPDGSPRRVEFDIDLVNYGLGLS